MTKLPELDQFLSALRRNGMRVTAERLHLFREVYSHHHHIDAEALLRSMKKQGLKISRATLYRNLDLLVEHGFIKKYRLGGHRYLYEHIHAGQRHDHLVCRECGRVVEFVSPAIEALQREICRAHRFDPDDHTLQIHGRCQDCESKNKASGDSVSASSTP